MSIISNIRIITKIGLVVLLLVVISFVVAGLNFNSITVQEEASAITNHTYRVMGEANLALAAMIDQETGMRGYLVSGDEKFWSHRKPEPLHFSSPGRT